MSVPVPADPNVAAFGASFGAFAALAAVTMISLSVGYDLRELLPTAVLPWLAAGLFTVFGLKLLIDAQHMGADGDEEEREAQQAIEDAERRHPITRLWSVMWEVFALVFIAELGYRTQLATIFLATAPAFTFTGLHAGTLAGHGLLTGVAVGSGKWIGQRINERLLYRLSGGLFIAFGLLSLQQAVG
jgi:putative Ca2+/H+ antiporter (TMEM165/GDT1 family)